jgi:PqqD family protein of HPr-rel-A system
MHWRLNSASLRWHDWGDESVVFNAESGATHLLNLVDRQVVRLFVPDGMLSSTELVQNLARALEIDVDTALEEYVATLLPQLEQVGLIESVPL